MTFRIEMLPASYGDALWIEYGPENDLRRVLIDGGPEETRAHLEKRITKDIEFDLVVVTHVDRDHIGGLLEYLERGGELRCKDFWFNTLPHLRKAAKNEKLGAKQGERLSKELKKRGIPLNQLFGGGPVFVPDEPDELPVKHLDGGMKITLLSPIPRTCAAMAKEWKKEVNKEGLGTGDGSGDQPVTTPRREGGEWLGSKDKPVSLRTDTDLAKLAANRANEPTDGAEANGSSIAFIAEYEGARVLFGADAHPDVLVESMNRLDPNLKIALDAFKIPHHGSRNNVTADLLGNVECTEYLVSTDGSKFGHPSGEAIARLITATRRDAKGEVTVRFVYDNEYTAPWKNPGLRDTYRYAASYDPKISLGKRTR